jgi:hypothetical protein
MTRCDLYIYCNLLLTVARDAIAAKRRKVLASYAAAAEEGEIMEEEDLTQAGANVPVRAGARLLVRCVAPAALRARQKSARTNPGEVEFERGDPLTDDIAGLHYDLVRIHRDQATTNTAMDLVLQAMQRRLAHHLPEEAPDLLADDLEGAKRDVGLNITGEEYERAVLIDACPGPGSTKGCYLYWREGMPTDEVECPKCNLSRYVDREGQPVGVDPREVPPDETYKERKRRKRKFKPRDVVRWWPLRYRLRKMWASVPLAKAMRYPLERPTRDGYILDVHDTPTWAKKLRAFNSPEDKSIYDHAFIISADATDFRNMSITPVYARNCSLRPGLRDRLGQVCMTLLFTEVIEYIDIA